MSIHDLPHLSSQYSLTEDQVESFQRNGHIYLPQVCSTEEVNIYLLNIALNFIDYSLE